jgi:hypothetical protein
MKKKYENICGWKFGEDHFMTSHKSRGEIDMREEGKESICMGLVILRINSSVLFVFVVVLR